MTKTQNDLWNAKLHKPGKGGAFNQVELKSVIKGTKLNERFRSNENVEKAEVDEKFNFLYSDESNSFMDNTSRANICTNIIIGNKLNYLEKRRDNNIIIR